MVQTKIEAEKKELEWLLTSGVLGRSGNLARLLKFVCEKHFEGQDDQIKEYTIAVEALERRPDFNSQTDTIVRVTAHALRKRLTEVYQGEGDQRPIHVVLPPGRYAPSFIHKQPTVSLATPNEITSPDVSAPKSLAAVEVKRSSRWLLVPLLLLVACIIGWFALKRTKPKNAQAPTARLTPAATTPPGSFHVLMGKERKPYRDHSGNRWIPDTHCAGGTTLTAPSQQIVGTEDPYLYLGGIRGIAHCTFPMKPGFYELHFYFAELSNLEPVTSAAMLSINDGPNISFDVVDNAGGHGIATSRVMRGVQPENDGSIHIDFISEVSFLNAIEILPTPTNALLPIRIAASSNSIMDSSKQLWLSDRYFMGGRRGVPPTNGKNVYPVPYNSDRIGTFHYSIPVIPLEKYRVRLYFHDPWFDQKNGVAGGPGSRIFDVSTTGNTLLKNLDIFAEGKGNPVVKTFDNIQASAQGKIDLYFTPVINHPLVNAIEILPEPER